MADREKELQDFHNDGQKDGANIEYHKPHGEAGIFFTEIIGGSKAANELREDNDAYEKGHDNGRESTSSCYLTTACVDFKGLGDNCEELATLRRFRDDYVTELTNGEELIAEYYQKAPIIVARINTAPDRADILTGIYSNVRTIVDFVKAGQNTKALESYTEMYKGLKKSFNC